MDVHLDEYKTTLTLVRPHAGDGDGGEDGKPAFVPLISQKRYKPYMTQEIMDDEGGIAAFSSVLTAADRAQVSPALVGAIDLYGYERYGDGDDWEEGRVITMSAGVHLYPSSRGGRGEPIGFRGAPELLRVLKGLFDGKAAAGGRV